MAQQQQSADGKEGEKRQQQGDPPGKPRRPPPPPLALIAGIVIAAALVVAFVFWGTTRIGYAFAHQSTDDARVDADSFTVTSKIAERVDRVYTDTNRRVSRGELLVALDDRDERARLAQAVASRNSAEAQAQQARQNLYLTRAQVATETEQSAGNLVSARSNVSNAAATYTSNLEQSSAQRAATAQATAQLRSAIEALPGARENLRRTSFDLARDSALLHTGDVSVSDVDADRAQYASAYSNYRQAQANVVAARANVDDNARRVRAQEAESLASLATIGARRGSVVQAQGRLAESETPYRITTQEAALTTALRQVREAAAQERLARDQLGYTRIYSPVDGAVAEKAIAGGQTIAPGQTLFTIVPSTSLYVTANYKETQLDLMRIGQPVDIHVDAYPELSFVGHVGEFNPASQNEYAIIPPQNSSGNFVKVTQRVPIRIFLDRGGDQYHPLRPGMSVETYVRVR